MAQDPIDDQVKRVADAAQKFSDGQKAIVNKRDAALNRIIKDAELKKASDIKKGLTDK